MYISRVGRAPIPPSISPAPFPEEEKMTRIRYKRFEDGTLRSGPVLCGGDALTAVINPATNTANILGSNGESMQTLGETTVAAMKKRVKQQLILFGANFSNEIRNRNVSKLS